MKRNTPLLLLMVVFMFACAGPAPTTSVPASQPAEAVTIENIATATVIAEGVTVEPAITATPEPPPPPHWYWTVDAKTAKVIAVNQFGERHELGDVDPSEDFYTLAIPLDSERALLFRDKDNNLRIYLLTVDGMQKIALPSDAPYYNTESSQTSRAVIAVHEQHVVFSYVTEGGSNVMPDRGPIFLIDLASLSAKMVDKWVSRGPYTDNRGWIHASQDGRYLRYRNGDRQKVEIRELDMVTGDARTLYTTSGSLFSIHASPQGDLWYLRNSKLVWDLEGNQGDFTDESQMMRPLKDGRAIVYPLDCVDDCEIKVVTPFGNEAELTYQFPWVIEFAATVSRVNQWLPDQSLLFVGQPYAYLSNIPAAAETYPELTDQDSPVFRLTPDGQADLIGIYAGSVSASGQYIFMRSTDQTSFFIYDAAADRPLFEMPVDPGLENFYPTVRFLENGILVNLGASVSGEQDAYRNFYYAYAHQTSNAVAWEDENLEYGSCPDLLEDGSVVCWIYNVNGFTFDLIRYDPASDTQTPLAENVWLIDFSQ
jgi:hypothetical protein